MLLRTGRIIALALVGSLALVPPTTAAAQMGRVERCAPSVRVLWDGVEFDVDDPDSARSDWFVRHLETVSEGPGCAGVAQTLILRDAGRAVLFQGTVVLDGQGNGTYTGVGVRVEDVAEVQVLLRQGGSGTEEGRRESETGAGRETDTAIGALAETGLDLTLLVALAALLVGVGVMARARFRAR